MKGDQGSGVSGEVRFMQKEGELIQIWGDFSGLKLGKHGFHIHEFGNLTEGCKSAGGHFNPLKSTHGGIDDEVRHVGDLGNVEVVDEKQLTKIHLQDRMCTLFGDLTIIGRSCVIHADEDDAGKGGHTDSLTTGHAGARLACGVIALSDNWQPY